MAERLRLAYVLLSPTFGMHQYTADLARRMSVAGHDVRVLTTRHRPPGRYAPAVAVEVVADRRNTGRPGDLLDRRGIRHVRDRLLAAAPDVVHFTGPHLWNGRLVRDLRARQIPVIHTLHDLDPHPGAGYGPLLHLWNGAILRSGATILVHGRRFRDRLLRNGRPPDQVVYTPLLHLFLSHQALARLKTTVPENGDGLLFFGRLTKYKGLDILLEAFASLGSMTPPPALAIAGPGRLPSQWSGHLPAGVDLHDRRIGDEEAVALFRRCAIVVLPYIEASQSAVIAAAYHFARPVIVSDVGALAEYVVPGVTGLVVKPGDPAALAGAMRTLLADPDRRRRMGAAARLWYDKQGAEKSAALEEIYRRLATARHHVTTA